jgi:hypothetical protein
MTPDEVLTLVHKLVNLSASPSEEEARTAALAACRLIREHKLTITKGRGSPDAEGGVSGEPRVQVDVSNARDYVNSFFDVLEKLSGPGGSGGAAPPRRGGGR